MIRPIYENNLSVKILFFYTVQLSTWAIPHDSHAYSVQHIRFTHEENVLH